MSDISILEEEMNRIASRPCERVTNEHNGCAKREGWYRTAAYGAYQWCDPCIAKDALERFDAAKYG